MQDRKRRIAETALGLIINPLKSEVVVGLGDAAKIGQRVAYLRPLVESRAADDPVRQAQGDEPLLEFSHLKGGADQDGDVVERNAFMLSRFDLLADKPRFFLAVRPFSDPWPISERLVSEQRLSQAAAIVGDQSRSDGKDVPRRSIVSLEPDHLRAGKILLEAQDVFDVRAAPGVDRLIVVADTAQIAVGLSEQPEKQILDDVRVLILVDQDVAEAPAECGEHVGVFAQQTQRLEQEIAEIHRIERFQPFLIVLIQRGAFAAGEPRRLTRWHALRIDPAILPSIDQICERSRRPAFVVQIFRLQKLLEQPQLVVGIENGEIRPQTHELSMHPQDLGADRMERAEPRHRLLGARGDAPTRWRISRAALLVKVTARIS